MSYQGKTACGWTGLFRTFTPEFPLRVPDWQIATASKPDILLFIPKDTTRRQIRFQINK